MRFPLLVSSFVTVVSLATPAAAESPCEADAKALVQALGKVPGGRSLQVVRGQDRVSWVDRGSMKLVLEADCAGVHVSLADGLVRPTVTKAPAVTKTEGPYTVSLTARGATSLSIAEGAAAPEAIDVALFDDDSVSVTDGRGRTWYSRVHRADGARVEIEGKHVGCGCERTTTPDGHVVEKAL